MTTSKRPDKRFLRLREAFRTRFPWKHDRLTRDGFRDWARQKRDVPINVAAQHWRPMRDGEPVPIETVEAFSEYIAFLHLLPPAECRLSVIAEPCDPPVKPANQQPGRLRASWMLGWRQLYGQLLDSFSIEEESYCGDEADLRFAAVMVLECVGWHDKKLTGSHAIAYGEAVLKRTADDYARFLLTLWQANEHAILFATHRQGGVVQRIGVNVTVALSEAFYRRYCRGEADEFQMQAEDFAATSPYLLGHAVAENVSIDLKRGKAARSLSHFRLILYQLASLFSPVSREGCNPHIVSIAGSKENAKRLRAYGFTPTGSKLPLNGKEIMEFAPPTQAHGLPYVKALAEYLPMKSLIQVFQAYIDSQRHHD